MQSIRIATDAHKARNKAMLLYVLIFTTSTNAVIPVATYDSKEHCKYIAQELSFEAPEATFTCEKK